MDDTREDMRRLIDVIEKGAKSTSIEQAVDDIKLFANTTSFLANALDTRLKSKDLFVDLITIFAPCLFSS